MQEAPPRHVPTESHPGLPTRLWPATPRGVHQARHALAETLSEWGVDVKDDELADSAALVLSELLTNAMQHAKAPGRMIGTRFVQLPDGALRIEVHDTRTELPQPRTAAALDERGRGLALVDTLTDHRWGTATREGPGKVVWAELAPTSGHCGPEELDTPGG